MKAIAKRRNQEKPGKIQIVNIVNEFPHLAESCLPGNCSEPCRKTVRLPLISGRLQENLAAAQPADGVEMAKRVLQLLDDEGR